MEASARAARWRPGDTVSDRCCWDQPPSYLARVHELWLFRAYTRADTITSFGQEPRGSRLLSLSLPLSIIYTPLDSAPVKLKPLCSEHFRATPANVHLAGVANVLNVNAPRLQSSLCVLSCGSEFPGSASKAVFIFSIYIPLGPRFWSLLCFWALFFF